MSRYKNYGPCKIDICTNTTATVYCVAHSKRWGTFRRRGFTEQKFVELMNIDHCEVCGTRTNFLYVDHDHTCCGPKTWCTKCVRGIVCPRCNNWLAGLDEKSWLDKAQRYLGYYSSLKSLNLNI